MALSTAEPAKVIFANGEHLCLIGQSAGLVQIGPWQAFVNFIVLNLSFEIILGMPWLMQANPRLDFAKGTLAVQRRGHWVALPTVMQQHSELSRVQHCDSSNASDISVQKVKFTGAHQ